MPGPRVTVRRLARRTLDAQQTAVALRGAARRRPPLRICWDLDNTLVDSGALLLAGRSLEQAIVEAEPLPGMLELHTALRRAVPEAAHVVLSARGRGLRRDTETWLRTHAAELAGRGVLLVPRAEDKPRVWRRLARGGRLLIVDDLTYGHEGPETRRYDDLIAQARAIATVELGVDDITALGAKPATADAVAAAAAAALRGAVSG